MINPEHGRKAWRARACAERHRRTIWAFAALLIVAALTGLVIQARPDSVEGLLPGVDWARRGAVVSAIILACGAGGSVLASWLLQAAAQRRALVDQFKAMSAQLARQERLIGALFAATDDQISVKRPDGSYTAVNDAFAAAVGRPAEQLPGQTDEVIFEPAAARRLAGADRQAERDGTVQMPVEPVMLGGRIHQLQIVKRAIRPPGGDVEAILTIARDVSEQVDRRRRREAGLRQVVEAMAHTVEYCDPYLSGHSRYLAAFAGLIARSLTLDAAQRETLEIAASLSQIGKLFVPRELLAKPARLSVEERQVVQRHMDLAANLLRDVDFGLPVQSALLQMYERLDGSGYPAGLEGEQIGLLGRILAVADVFTARIRPRAYRMAIAPERALQILRSHPERYDAGIVAALAGVMHSREGRLLLSEIAEESQVALRA